LIKGHGGNIYELARRLGCAASDIIDMSSNVNPLGPPPGLADFLRENINTVTALPEVEAESVIQAFAEKYELDPDLVLAGNGTTQFIYNIPYALGTRKACILGPTYSDYADACIMHRVEHFCSMTHQQLEFQPDLSQLERDIKTADTVFICNPNNPTGVLIPANDLSAFCKSHPETTFIIDESYLPFVIRGEEQSMSHCGLSNVIVLNSMSKIFRVPGLRIGFLIASDKKMIEKFRRYMLPWSVNSLAQAAVIYLMEQKAETDAFIEKTRNFLEIERNRFSEAFKHASGIKLFPSAASFMLAGLLKDQTSDEICRALAEDKILIRNCSNFKGLSERFVRISLKTADVNHLMAEKMKDMLN